MDLNLEGLTRLQTFLKGLFRRHKLRIPIQRLREFLGVRKVSPKLSIR